MGIESIGKKRMHPHEINARLLHGDYFNVCSKAYLNEEMMEIFDNQLNWDLLSKHQRMSIKFMEKHFEKLDKYYLCKHQILTEEFMDSYWPYLGYYNIIAQYQKLSEDFIYRHLNDFTFEIVIRHQEVSEDMLEKYMNTHSDFYWIDIFENSKLSEEFIEKHIIGLRYYFDKLLCRQFFNKEFIEKLAKKVIKYNKSIDIKTTWECKDYIKLNQKVFNDDRNRNQKLLEMANYAAKYNLEFNSDKGYLIAYREHMNYRGSYKKTWIYDSIGYYKDWRCDLNPENQNSFGLGIWPKGNVKVRIGVDDWGCEVMFNPVYNSEGKARVFGFTLLNVD